MTTDELEAICENCGHPATGRYCCYGCLVQAVERDTLAKEEAAWRAGEGEGW